MRKTTLSVRDHPTREEIEAWPAVVSVERGSNALGFSKSHGLNLIRRGEFPCRVIAAGHRKLVVTASLLRVLDGGAA